MNRAAHRGDASYGIDNYYLLSASFPLSFPLNSFPSYFFFLAVDGQTSQLRPNDLTTCTV